MSTFQIEHIKRKVRRKKERHQTYRVAVVLYMVLSVVAFTHLGSKILMKRVEIASEGIDLGQSFLWICASMITLAVSMRFSFNYVRKDYLDKSRISLWITLILAAFSALLQLLLIEEWLYNKVESSLHLYASLILSFYLIQFMFGLLWLAYLIYRHHHYKLHSKKMMMLELLHSFFIFKTLLWFYLGLIFLTLQG